MNKEEMMAGQLTTVTNGEKLEVRARIKIKMKRIKVLKIVSPTK